MSKIDLTLATPQQINEIKGNIRDMEKMINNPKIQDKSEFQAEINKKKKLLSDYAPKELRGKNKDKAFKRAQELKKFIQDNMPRKKDYFKSYPKNGCDNDFERAVKQQMAYQSNPKIQKATQEYKYLMGRLEPQDPTCRNVENFRK